MTKQSNRPKTSRLQENKKFSWGLSPEEFNMIANARIPLAEMLVHEDCPEWVIDSIFDSMHYCDQTTDLKADNVVLLMLDQCELLGHYYESEIKLTRGLLRWLNALNLESISPIVEKYEICILSGLFYEITREMMKQSHEKLKKNMLKECDLIRYIEREKEEVIEMFGLAGGQPVGFNIKVS